MRGLRIEVPFLPPQSLNPNSRVSWTQEWQDKKIYGTAVYYCAIDARNRTLARLYFDFTPFQVARIDLELVYPVERTRDRDNAIASFKSGLDSLVKAGILMADDSKHLHWGAVTFTISKEDAPKTIITLTEEG